MATAKESHHARQLREATAKANEKALAEIEAKKAALIPDEIHDDMTEAPVVERRYPGQAKIDSDLFKLNVAVMVKNVAWQEDTFEPVNVEHVHFFRTMDSQGRKQTMSAVTPMK